MWAKQSNSELQLRDVRQLLMAVADIDQDYLDEWSVKEKVDDLLNEARDNE